MARGIANFKVVFNDDGLEDKNCYFETIIEAEAFAYTCEKGFASASIFEQIAPGTWHLIA